MKIVFLSFSGDTHVFRALLHQPNSIITFTHTQAFRTCWKERIRSHLGRKRKGISRTNTIVRLGWSFLILLRLPNLYALTTILIYKSTVRVCRETGVGETRWVPFTIYVLLWKCVFLVIAFISYIIKSIFSFVKLISRYYCN